MNNGRKPIQITTAFTHYGKYLVFALCDDGTIWELKGLFEGKPQWKPFPIPPQDYLTGENPPPTSE